MLELLFLRGLGLGLGRFGVILGRIVDSVGQYVRVLVSAFVVD